MHRASSPFFALILVYKVISHISNIVASYIISTMPALRYTDVKFFQTWIAKGDETLLLGLAINA